MTLSSLTDQVSFSYNITLGTQAECNLLITCKGKPQLINKAWWAEGVQHPQKIVPTPPYAQADLKNISAYAQVYPI